jgi:hypothetical protein
MNNRLHLIHLLHLCARIVPALVIVGTGVQAATFTWDGGGADNNFGTTGNWDTSSPTSDADIIFAGSTRPNITGSWSWSLNSVTFASGAGAFTINGGGYNIGGGGIINNSGNTQTINAQLSLTGNQTWNAAGGAIVLGTAYLNAGGNNLTLTGASSITLGGQVGNVANLTLSGGGNRIFSSTQTLSATTLTASGTGTNTFSGQVNTTTINLGSGTTHFANTGTAAQAGSGGINISGTASATFSGNVAGGSGGINITSSGDVTFAGRITGGSLTLNGTGTTTLSGNGDNNISNTVVNSGTLIMAQTGGGDSINGPLTINNGGTVIFSGDNQVPQWETVTLNEGSTLLLGDTTQTIQHLVITGDSIIDFGSNGSQLNIGSGGITLTDNITVTIVNWNAAAGDVFAGANPGAPVVNVQYADDEGNIYATGTWGGGYVTPGTPVPEPSTHGFLMLGGAIGLIAWRRRQVRG